MTFSEIISFSSQDTPICIVNQSASQPSDKNRREKLIQLPKTDLNGYSDEKVCANQVYYSSNYKDFCQSP